MTSKEKAQDKSTGKSTKTASAKSKTAKPGKKTDDSAKTKELQKELQEQKDKYLRLSADFDNFRKRTLREKMEMSKLAGEEIYVKILPVLDDLERAMKVIDEAKDLEAVKDGMLLIYNKFKEYLNQQGVKEIDAIHQEFDTDVHEAVTQIPEKDKKLKGKVVDIVEKGYYLNEKVIRYAKVVIGV
ncbi:nucleotide exchange factor GrpE [Bacteroidota bacterium]